MNRIGGPKNLPCSNRAKGADGKRSTPRILSAVLAALFFATPSTSFARELRLFDHDGWKLSLTGFFELDAISDSTRSFAESANNGPVSRSDTAAGQSGRTQFSIRDSRIGFALVAPDADGWKTKAWLEFDFMGTTPSPGSASGTSESNFYNNPSLRLRHASVTAESGGWQLLAGQTWNLFGWQPYYFIPSLQAPAFPGQAFSRTAQLRVTKATDLSSDVDLHGAFGVMRPPQRDSEYPGLEGGLRFALNSRKSGFTGGAIGARKAQPMSLGLSGALREFAIPRNAANPDGELVHYPGSALAVDFLLPVLAARGDQDVGGSLTLGGEFTTGRGYGDEFPGWTGNLANPLNSVKTAPQANANLDGGLGDFDSAGAFRLVDLNTANLYFQYHLATESRAWISGGVSRVASDNIQVFTTAGKTSAGSVAYSKIRAAFLNLAHDLNEQLRIGVEFAHESTNYVDGNVGHNNRYQASVWFIF